MTRDDIVKELVEYMEPTIIDAIDNAYTYIVDKYDLGEINPADVDRAVYVVTETIRKFR